MRMITVHGGPGCRARDRMGTISGGVQVRGGAMGGDAACYVSVCGERIRSEGSKDGTAACCLCVCLWGGGGGGI